MIKALISIHSCVMLDIGKTKRVTPVKLIKEKSIECFYLTSRKSYWCQQKIGTAAMWMYQTYPVGVEFFSYVKTYNKFACECVGHVSKTFYRS